MRRGAGTCNRGQGIPLAGGAVVDMSAQTGGLVEAERSMRVAPGSLMADIDPRLQAGGHEVRIPPSSRAAKTIGGGHVGIGLCTWGILHDIGNTSRVAVISVELTPRGRPETLGCKPRASRLRLEHWASAHRP
ncbi:FAD-binding oxidoreductase [Yangia mangrovi]|uniref:FAD-binding oxidoreductase n=1 Tax=Alloyangia mangrovi TaxID=1779329 RepID=A0ABT2KF57_9RHOB|nr:hypothetical protein [Alloyangia mangrovi]MCT4368995.1 FAD-binding oxidoreductase [Alloyangia mangrovi]